MAERQQSEAAAYERGMQEGLDLRDHLREEIASLRERLGDREQDLKILGNQLQQAVEALRRIAKDDCMTVDGEPGGWIDTGAPQRIAQDVLDDLKWALEGDDVRDETRLEDRYRGALEDIVESATDWSNDDLRDHCRAVLRGPGGS